ncbi:MAG: LuxR C-terminal-related transcriptional regulator [Bacteroidales bacterium]|nr:LuxR C-terminal-related transcriptional regulator [Bacteroidales bacterium]
MAANHEMENRLQRVLSHLNVYLYIMDLDAQELVWTFGDMNTLMGFDPFKVKLSPLQFAEKYFHPKDSFLMQERMELFLDGRVDTWAGIYRIKHKNRRWIWVYSRWVQLEKYAPDDPLLLAGLLMDATTGLRTEMQLSFLIQEALKFKNGDRIKKLTKREVVILKLIAEGHTYTEIGKKLHIQPDTVNKHRKNILHKLELKNIATLICFAKEVGLV